MHLLCRWWLRKLPLLVEVSFCLALRHFPNVADLQTYFTVPAEQYRFGMLAADSLNSHMPPLQVSCQLESSAWDVF